LPKESFSESDLQGLQELRRLLFQLHKDETASENEYQAKIKRLLSYRFLITAQKVIDIEIDLLRRIVGEQDDQPTDDDVDDTLMSYLVDAFAERMKD
jgi:hypothetical protein